MQNIDDADSSIAGLPAEVVADLAREALNGTPDTSEAALATLATLSVDPGWEAVASQTLLGAWTQSRTFAVEHVAIEHLWLVLGAATVLFAGRWFARRWKLAAVAQPSHDRSPHRRAYAEAVTHAAQLLAKGEQPSTVSQASGLARDLISVVGSRRLVSAPIATLQPPAGGKVRAAGGYAATAPSSGRKARGARATYPGRILK